MKNGSGIAGVLGILVCAALFFVVRGIFPGISNIILTILGIGLLLIIGLVVLVFVLAVKGKSKKQPREEDGSALLTGARKSLMEMRRLAIGAKSPEVRMLSENICSSAGRILSVLKDQPEDVQRTRKFLAYYLPTTTSVLHKYVRLEQGNMADAATEAKTVSCLKDIGMAMERQYANLFDNDILDLTVEMETLTQVCRRDGLLEDEKYKLPGGNIDLTL